jgi:NADH-quinone oxidoreductase subunit N
VTFDWLALAPVVIVSVTAVVVLLADAFAGVRRWAMATVGSIVALVACGVVTAVLDGDPRATMCSQAAGVGGVGPVTRCSYAVDGFTVPLWWIVLAASALVVLLAAASASDLATPPGELHFLLLASVAGALTLAAARELVSLPSIALVAVRRGDHLAARSAWTFFLASVTATAITLMGASLVYGATGSVHYGDIAAAIENGALPLEVLRTGVVFLLAGLIFKIGAVPFHMWVPDTYAGADTAVAAYLSVVSKTAGFAGLLIVLALPFEAMSDTWSPMMAVVAGVTMTVGNLAALRSSDAIGLLAWSSVAQAGFVLAPVAALLLGPAGTDSGLYASIRYLGIYALANMAAFAAVAHVRSRTGRTDLESFRGLLRRDPLAGVTLSFALLALAGFPPAVIGLVAKYVVLRPVVEDGHAVLAVVMAVNVAIGLAYYLRFLVVVLSPASVASGRVLVVGQRHGPRLAMGLGLAALLITSAWPGLVTSVLL